jgi:hypothetical protein
MAQRRKKPGPVPHSKKPPPNPAPSKTHPVEKARKKANLMRLSKSGRGKGRCAPDRSGGPLSLRGLSGLCNIPYETFKKYVAKDSRKRRVRGESVGRAPLVGKEDQRFLADVMAFTERVMEQILLKPSTFCRNSLLLFRENNRVGILTEHLSHIILSKLN